MAVRPTVSDLRTWANLDPFDGSDADTDPLTDCLDAAIEAVEARITLPADADDGNYPRRARTAILMQAHRYAKRRTTPEGIVAFGDLGAVRLGSIDPDIEALLGGLLKLDGFA